jgi:hypothetical protein
MNPAKQLNRAIALFTQLFTKNGQTIEVEIEQIGRHGAPPDHPMHVVTPW